MPAQSADNERLLNEIVDNLRILGAIKVKYPYAMNKGNEVDYILDFLVTSEYKGNPINFLISFPGYIIFAPWWNGYNYNTIINRKIETKYKCKHSEFDRTWTQGVDWLLTYGIASLIGGIIYISYDNDITSEFVRKYAPNYG